MYMKYVYKRNKEAILFLIIVWCTFYPRLRSWRGFRGLVLLLGDHPSDGRGTADRGSKDSGATDDHDESLVALLTGLCLHNVRSLCRSSSRHISMYNTKSNLVDVTMCAILFFTVSLFYATLKP